MTFANSVLPLFAEVYSRFQVCCEEPQAPQSLVSKAQRPTSQPLFREKAGSAPAFKRSQQAQPDSRGRRATSTKY